MSETDLVQALLVALSAHNCMVWRHNSGKLQDRRGRWVSFGLVGSADIVGWCRAPGCARFIAVECKAPKGKLSEAQVAFGAQALAAGVIYCVARSVDDALRALSQHRCNGGTS